MASAVGGYVTTFGKDEPCGSYDDIDNATCLFIIGSNTSECHPILFRRIADRKQANPHVKIIVVDPRKTNTARIADMHLAFKPGHRSGPAQRHGLRHHQRGDGRRPLPLPVRQLSWTMRATPRPSTITRSSWRITLRRRPGPAHRHSRGHSRRSGQDLCSILGQHVLVVHGHQPAHQGGGGQ